MEAAEGQKGAPAEGGEGSPRSFRYTCWLFGIVVVGTGLGGMTQTALNTMVPVVLADLGSEIGWGQWLATLYIFAMGAAVPLASFLQRRFSVRRLMTMAFGLYLAGSLCDFMAVDFAMLLAGRVLEAVATGVLMPLLQTIAMTRFPANRHGTAMGIAGIALGFAPNIGPVVGGALCEAAGWRAMFLILACASAVLLALTFALVSERDAREPAAALDWPSLVLSTLGFGGVLLGFTAAANMALCEPLVWAPVVLGVAAVGLFGGIFLALGAVGIAFVPLDGPLWLFAAFQTLRCIGLTTLIPSTTAWGLGPLGARGLTPDGSAALIMSRQVFAALATAIMVFIVKQAALQGMPALGFQGALAFSGVLALGCLACTFAFVREESARG